MVIIIFSLVPFLISVQKAFRFPLKERFVIVERSKKVF